jgi:hypothetical protein
VLYLEFLDLLVKGLKTLAFNVHTHIIYITCVFTDEMKTLVVSHVQIAVVYGLYMGGVYIGSPCIGGGP